MKYLRATVTVKKLKGLKQENLEDRYSGYTMRAARELNAADFKRTGDDEKKSRPK